jgi:hypothetical protein
LASSTKLFWISVILVKSPSNDSILATLFIPYSSVSLVAL